MRYLFLFFVLGVNGFGLAQERRSPDKPGIGFETFGKWPMLIDAKLTDDGHFVLYSESDPTTYAVHSFVKDLHSNWEMALPPGQNQFAEKGELLVYLRGEDSIGILNLHSKAIEYITNIATFSLSGDSDVRWLAYTKKNSSKMALVDLSTGNKNIYDSVSSFHVDAQGSGIVVEAPKEDGSRAIDWIRPERGARQRIWVTREAGDKIGNFVFARNGMAIAFMTENKNEKTVWYYGSGAKVATVLGSDYSYRLDSALTIDGFDYRGFNGTDSGLLINLSERQTGPGSNTKPGVDLWSYMDGKLQSQQLVKKRSRSFVGFIRAGGDSLVRLEREDERLLSIGKKYSVVAQLKGNGIYDEWYWNKKAGSAVYLVDLQSGARRLIAGDLPANIALSYSLSPEERYVIYYDANGKNYFSYELRTGRRRNITAGSGGNWTSYIKRDVPASEFMPTGGGGWIRAGWLADDKGVLLYDQFDIYLVDPSGRNAAISLTSRYGKQHNLEFRMAISENKIYFGDENLVVSAFDRKSKMDGFFRIRLGKQEKPEKLTLQPCVFKGTWEAEWVLPFYPVKSRKSETYVVRRMTAEESPNYFWTNDFKTFNRITDIHPEKSYNWLTTELINWQSADGSMCQGILYKPENLDSKKKYPIIFHYYENMTEGLYAFPRPDYTAGALNIPYYVSNGYLVFTPDIHYIIGHPGQSVVNTMTSALRRLSGIPYVDINHVGLQGHSRGGWETNMVITHTNLFAAAMSASGFCDYVSLYDGIAPRMGVSRQGAYERLFQRIGTPLWGRPDLYIENSPIFQAQHVKTPLLMMNNKEDSDIPFEQGVEFFTALRRLGKKAWMLQYDGKDHTVNGEAAKDLEIRMKQFFDHYLKGEGLPEWMASGIPANRKGLFAGLDIVSGAKESEGLPR